MGNATLSKEVKPQLSEEIQQVRSNNGSRADEHIVTMEENAPEKVTENNKEIEKKVQTKEALARISAELRDLRQSKDDLEKEREMRVGLERQINALKEVSSVSNEMLKLREVQVSELKKRIEGMESLAEENMNTLRLQYETQIENIRKLKKLYEERAEATSRGHERELDKERAKIVLLELKLDEYRNDGDLKQQLDEKIIELTNRLNEKETENEELKSERLSHLFQINNLQSQQTVINSLFSNLLTSEMNFDTLTQILQDNHNLISDLIANGDINDTVALLKDISEKSVENVEPEADPEITSTMNNIKEEIASNLPKVWRVLIELLSKYEYARTVPGTSTEKCYKNISTPSGSRTVISVSQTFLRLKDLILEKNCLVKEVGRLKTLNGHLENRLTLQEKRLGVVTSELRKTWGVVSKLKVQHRQLHTHEKVLRYELQHKRQMLTDLKSELVYCRKTWDKAREKNSQTEHDWEQLRKEFALRKSRDAFNSAESGYEDDESSQSPDLSTSDMDDISPVTEETKIDDFSIELDAASDETVIELIDLLELDPDPIVEDTIEDEEIVLKIQTAESDVVLNELEQNDLDKVEVINDKNSKVVDSGLYVENNCAGRSNDIIDSVTINTVVADECIPSTSTNSEACKTRSSEEILDARAKRLKRLEEQCKSLLTQMAITSLRSDTLNMRLEELHVQYGTDENRSRETTNGVSESPSTNTPYSDNESENELSEEINANINENDFTSEQ